MRLYFVRALSFSTYLELIGNAAILLGLLSLVRNSYSWNGACCWSRHTYKLLLLPIINWHKSGLLLLKLLCWSP